MQLEENVSLKLYNSFGIDAKARYFARFKSVEDLQTIPSTNFILGAGSNILFTRNFDGLVIKILIVGIEKVGETDTHVLIKSGAGMVWHELVMTSMHST